MVVVQWLNFFQRSHHSSVQHLPLVHGESEPWKDPVPRAPPKAPQPASIDMTGWDSD